MKIHLKNAALADRRELPGQSEETANILVSFEQISDTRETRVQKIKKSIDAGTYTVDPRKLAASILRSMHDIDNIDSINNASGSSEPLGRNTTFPTRQRSPDSPGSPANSFRGGGSNSVRFTRASWN